MTARVGVITFPGTLDDVDAARAVRLAGAEAVSLWHADADLKGVDAVIVPGGFSYGDYLRCGAIAKFAPVMGEVISAAGRGLPVLGICNGFQVLCEAGLLPAVGHHRNSRAGQCEGPPAGRQPSSDTLRCGAREADRAPNCQTPGRCFDKRQLC